ncbi:unnamed protein product [Phytomonas sp. Hart1]|nr:unnamed protein product [Phytomonas sp. Hart1]|eukprot:CCW68182.1 unnamed protein product [Phytomonas sp. isolate Hart1]
MYIDGSDKSCYYFLLIYLEVYNLPVLNFTSKVVSLIKINHLLLLLIYFILKDESTPIVMMNSHSTRIKRWWIYVVASYFIDPLFD